MEKGAITQYIDVAQVTLYAFWIFFALLIFYLRREDRREGYPLESEASGRQKDPGFLLIPEPKTFLLPHGGTQIAPRREVDNRELRAVKSEPWPGAPLVPTGDPMTAGVGPGSWAQRADVPDLTHEGHDKIVPLRIADGYAIAMDGPDPRGYAVVGADGQVAGKIADAWVDRAELLLRYYEVELASGAHVLLPVTFAKVNRNGTVSVPALLASQFAGVPPIKSPDRVTFLEEERVVAYYGAGTLYATAARAEPLL